MVRGTLLHLGLGFVLYMLVSEVPFSDHLSGQRLLLLLIIRRALPFDLHHVLDIAIQLGGMLLHVVRGKILHLGLGFGHLGPVSEVPLSNHLVRQRLLNPCIVGRALRLSNVDFLDKVLQLIRVLQHVVHGTILHLGLSFGLNMLVSQVPLSDHLVRQRLLLLLVLRSTLVLNLLHLLHIRVYRTLSVQLCSSFRLLRLLHRLLRLLRRAGEIVPDPRLRAVLCQLPCPLSPLLLGFGVDQVALFHHFLSQRLFDPLSVVLALLFGLLHQG